MQARKCLRCGAEMDVDFSFTGGGGNVIRRRGLSGKSVYPKAAVCLHCGEISLFVDDEQMEKLKK